MAFIVGKEGVLLGADESCGVESGRRGDALIELNHHRTHSLYLYNLSEEPALLPIISP